MNKKVTSLLAFFIILTASDGSFAQQTMTLTLDQSIEYAKENSPLSRAARYSILSAKWRYKSFRADLLPSFSLTGDAPNYNKSIFSNTLDDGTITFSSSTQSEASAALSIDQNILPTGGTLSLSSGITRLGIFKDENTYLWQSTPLVASFRQPLFQYNSLKWRNRTEPLLYRIAQKEYVEDMEEIAYTVTQAYFDVLLAKINIEVADFNVTVNDSIYNISQGRFQVGNIAENELLQTELEYRNAQSSLTTAILQYQRSEENFKALLGIDDAVELEVDVPPVAPEIFVDVDEALSLAVENNSTFLEYELSEIIADQTYDQAKRNAGFSATVRADYGLNQVSSDFDQLYEDPENRQFFTVGFEIPIFNWGKNTAEIRAARNEQQETANTIAYNKLQFELSVKGTVREFSQLREQVELAEISDDIATRRYDVAKNRYLIGRIDITDLFLAQGQKDSSRRSYIQALRTYWEGYYTLRRLTLFDFEKDMPILYITEF